MNELKGHRSIIIFIFFVVPLVGSKAAAIFGIHDIGIVYGWKKFYSAALGRSNEYALAATLYLLMAPLAVIWINSMASFQGISRIKASILSVGCAAVSFVLLCIIILGPPISSIEAPAQGMRFIISVGRSHAAFCAMYGAFVISFIATAYASIFIFFYLIKDIYKGMRDEG